MPQFFLLCLKRNNSQTLKSIATTKTLFPSVYVIGTTCFDKLFLLHWRLEENVLSLNWGSFQLLCSCVAWNKWLEISPCFNFYPHNTNTKVKVKCKYQSFKVTLIYHTKDIIERLLPYLKFFNFFYFLMRHIFLCK